MEKSFPDSRSDEYFVYSYYCNNRKKLRISGIAQILQESAWLHAESCNLGYHALKEMGFLWVLSGLKIKILALPDWGEKIELKTWGRSYDKLLAYRDFRIKDSKGHTRIEATSSWLIIDEESRRPKRITEDMHKIPFYSNILSLENPGKIDIPKEMPGERSLKVLYSDIDVYNHVNNTRYIQWCIDSLPEYQEGSFIINSFEIRFISETHLGDMVIIKFVKEGNQIYFSGWNEGTGREIFRALIGIDLTPA